MTKLYSNIYFYRKKCSITLLYEGLECVTATTNYIVSYTQIIDAMNIHAVQNVDDEHIIIDEGAIQNNNDTNHI